MPSRLSKICQTSPLLPILVGVLTVVSMFAANANRGLNFGMLAMPLIMVCCWALLWWLLFWVIPKARGISAAMASCFVLVTMFWGAFPQLPQKFVLTFDMIPFLCVVIAGILVARYRRAVNKYILMVTAVVVLAILMSLGQAGIGIALASGKTGNQAMANVEARDELPDIYFIVPDRFTSPDALRECGVDPSQFVTELRARGFYVREDSLSNDPITPESNPVDTTRTLRFLASVLNFGRDIDLHIGYNEAGKMVRNPEVAQVLHSMGYKFYNVGSWYAETAVSRVADYNYVYKASNPVQWLYADEFGAAVLDRSILRYIQATNHQAERDRELFQLQSAKDIALNGDSPKFVFVHLLLPHPPFVWTADGQPQESETLGEEQLYLEQVQFTEGYLLEMVDSIPGGAIVILQADEGMCFPGSDLTYGLSDTQFNGVLSAWLIPSANEDVLRGVGITDVLKYAVDGLAR
jgi:hypothetical protein